MITFVVGGGGTTYFWTDNWVGKVPLWVHFSRHFDLTENKWATVEDMARRGCHEQGGVWVWRRRLLAWEEECVRECSVLLHDIVLQDHFIDRWKWLLDSVNGYSVKGIYHFLTTIDEPSERELSFDVWHKHFPLKVSLFTWRLFRNRLPTKDNLVRRRVLFNTMTTSVLDIVTLRRPPVPCFLGAQHLVECGAFSCDG